MPPTPSVSIISAGPLTGGLAHNLTCSSTVIPGLISGPILVLEGPGVNQPGVELTGEMIYGPLSLYFSSLLTGYGGVYTCTARLSIPEAGVDISETNTTTVVVQSMMDK